MTQANSTCQVPTAASPLYPGTCTASNKPDTDTSNSTRMEIPEAHKSVTCLMQFHHQPVFCYHSVCLSPPLLCKQVQHIGTSINEPGTKVRKRYNLHSDLEEFSLWEGHDQNLKGPKCPLWRSLLNSQKKIQKATYKSALHLQFFGIRSSWTSSQGTSSPTLVGCSIFYRSALIFPYIP